MPFDLWAIPGRKSLSHDGTDLRLRVRAGGELVGLVLSEALCDGDRFACVVPVGTERRPARARLDLALGLLGKKPSARTRPTLPRPTRTALFYAHALQALDGHLAGATHREIAVALFGEERVAREWNADSHLRGKIRHMVDRSCNLMKKDFTTFLD